MTPGRSSDGRSTGTRPLDRRSTDELLRSHRRCGDPAVLEEIVRRFEPLARSVARRYQSRGESSEDLIQVAMVGLVKAIRRYDPDRGFAFTTYAMPTMVGELKRHLRDSGWALHVPRGTKERALEVARISDELTSRLGRSPSVVELAQRLECSEEQVLDAIEAYHARFATPLDARPIDDEEPGPTLAQVLGVEDERLEQAEYLAMIAAGVQTLSETDRLILWLRFGRDMTQSEIAARIGVSQMHVSRLLRAAIEKIRDVSVGPGDDE